ncbi:hypothetical protein SARC_04649 [Sphaeroforma arctica JP610]|uniref:Uncharacterized protein n=1 Tax=Sphaeroforma arctica JP610 TaxID=667725 RepID=A0A0L0G2R5_9EUKA|nr:hypothetical protein SARC_04649 [Sphaeroforma arctica JP610]KNC83091.1 hypothetical protein SARC_04649 [Sphaeroforma arctica JP610]|eukprot:XP_014156993.1 hypothetical protein SARC_04649 [Sphaeroforma arctica JP610]
MRQLVEKLAWQEGAVGEAEEPSSGFGEDGEPQQEQDGTVDRIRTPSPGRRGEGADVWSAVHDGKRKLPEAQSGMRKQPPKMSGRRQPPSS